MNNHPIQPPADLIEHVVFAALDEFSDDGGVLLSEIGTDRLETYTEKLGKYVANYFAQWGADQELDACCEWVGNVVGECDPAYDPSCLHDARRPSPIH
jgi:hypothetical protein